MREAAKLQKEIEAQRKKIEKEQTHYQTAYEKLLKQLESSPDDADLIQKKSELETQLQDIDKAMKADKYLSRYEEDHMRRPGYLDDKVKAYRKDLDGHKKALAGRPDNGRYSRKTSQDIKDYHYKQIKKYVEETVNPKKRFKFGRLK